MDYLVLIGFIALLLLGVPLYIFLFALSSYLFLNYDIPILSTVVSFQKLQSQEFVSAIPLFTYAGYLLSRSNSPQRIVQVTQACFSFIPASSSIVVILLMALFTALTGASGVSILALGALMFPVVHEASKNEKFTHGLITASGSIGLLFAPSLPVIIYTIIANQNSSQFFRIEIDTLFKVAIIPSILLIGSFILYSLFIEKSTKLTLDVKKAWAATKNAKWEVPLPFLVYGGIYSGWFTVLEAGIVTAIYTTVIVFFINRDLKIKGEFMEVTVDSLKLAGNIFIIMATAFILTNFIVYQQIPDKIFAFISPYLQNKYTFLLAVNVLLLITGCLLDIFSAILIVLPLIIPIVEKYGINPYHFAIIFLVNLEIGYITPPVGINLFIASFRFKKNIIYLYKSTVPFLILMIFNLAILTYIPQITTFLTGDDNQGVAEVDRVAPQRVNDLQATQSGEDFISLQFSPSKDNSGFATQYTVYYLDEEEFDVNVLLDFSEFITVNAEELTENNNNKLTLTLTLNDLFPETTYSLMIVAIDQENNSSIPSDIVSISTK